MKSLRFSALVHAQSTLLPLLAVPLSLSAAPAVPIEIARGAPHAKLPIVFTLNKGQTDPQVKYLSHGKGYSVFSTPTAKIVNPGWAPLILTIEPAREPARRDQDHLLRNASRW